MNVLYFYLFLLVHPYLAMWWKSFEKAGHHSWEALLPGYNYFVAFKISCQKPWWSLLMIFPGVHLVMWSVVNTSYIRRFGYYSLADTFQGIFFPYIIMAKIATSEDKILPETNWANSKEVSEREWGDHLALFLALPVIGHVIALGISAVTRPKPGKKTKVKEWGDSLIFALVAASIIRTYVFEPFQIPTGSMEKTLLVGDFLFVNKLAYGPKVPVTPLSYPLVHNTVPWVNIKSYTTLEKANYTRLPGFTDVNRFDVVVFNYPSGDTAVYDPRMPDGLMGHDYHGIVLDEAFYLFQKESGGMYQQIRAKALKQLNQKYPNRPDNWKNRTADSLSQEHMIKNYLDDLEVWKSRAREVLAEEKIAHRKDASGTFYAVETYGVIYRPVDKRENYIKRCVGTPGDWIEIKKSVLFVNDQPVEQFPHQNLQYYVTNIVLPSYAVMTDKYGLEKHRGGTENGDFYAAGAGYIMNLTQDQLNELSKEYPEANFELILEDQYSDTIQPAPSQMMGNLNYFPKDMHINNTRTDFNKFQIPYKGQKVKLTKDNIAWYRRVIHAYEGHELLEKKDGIYIDGKKTDTYTVEMDYFWMMGDNRYNSADSRVWGYVPEDHIVGKASLVWFSKDPIQGIRWNRIFTWIE